MNLVYDDEIGWFDADEEYCVEDGCTYRATNQIAESMIDDNLVVVLVCNNHTLT